MAESRSANPGPGRRRYAVLPLMIALVALAFAQPREPFVGTLHLRDGAALRGRIAPAEGGYTLTNIAGEVFVPAADVERIERHAAPASQPAATQPATQPVEAEADDASDRQTLAMFVRLAPDDIKRLKLAEYQVDPAEKTPIRMLRTPDGTLAEIVAARIRTAPEFNALNSALQDQLARLGGTPAEQLGVVRDLTEDEFLDRIQIRGETQTFRTFRRTVLPPTAKGCARAGCHGGPNARVFRLPSGTSENDGYAAFVILDSLETEAGPLLNRENPGDSVLLQYLLPPEEATVVHPPLERGRLTPAWEDRRAEGYEAVRAWIAGLRVPRPDYRLETDLPEWLSTAEEAAEE